MKRGMKTVLIWGLLLGVAVFAWMSRDRPQPDNDPDGRVFTEQAIKLIDEGRIVAYYFQDRSLRIVQDDRTDLAVIPGTNPEVVRHLAKAQVAYVDLSTTHGSSGGSSILFWLVFALLLILLLIYLLKRFSGGQMNNIFELRKSKARPVADVDKATFSDIGGNTDAVELLADIVDYLKAPQRWKKAGTRIPRGVLVVGPPGTGKTLLARAVAGETNSTFFYTSAAEFVELFVGVGAARVRDTFEQAAAKQPAVIFIDELDAIGRRRGSGIGTMHEEREQTLNQLLVLMDGLEQHQQLVVMAATNRPDVLDPALMRSGRFDRLLQLDPPEISARSEILAIHTRNKPIDDDVSLDRIAKRAEGFTGADLEALTNEAALIAVRRSRDDENGDGKDLLLSNADFDRAFESMTKSNRQFNRLDSVLVESVTQFAEPTGRAVTRSTLTTGTVIEGEVEWMNSAHIKLITADGNGVIIAKEMAEQIVSLEGTDTTPSDDFRPDRWASKQLDVG